MKLTLAVLVAVTLVAPPSSVIAHGHHYNQHHHEGEYVEAALENERHLRGLAPDNSNMPEWVAAKRALLKPDTKIKDKKTGKWKDAVRCGSIPVREPSRRELDAEKAMVEEITSGRRRLYPRVSIPVAFHVVHNNNVGKLSIQMVQDQIKKMNTDFQAPTDTGFSFELVSTDWTNNAQWYDNCDKGNVERRMKNALAVDPATHLNVYTCGTGYLGWAYFPDSASEGHTIHGVVLLDECLPGGSASPYNKGDTATHEIGHYLGLYHTFQGGCDTSGDMVSDTPPQASPDYDCSTNRDTCRDGDYEDNSNIMDYGDDACMDHFTDFQIACMHQMTSSLRPTIYYGTTPPPSECPGKNSRCNSRNSHVPKSVCCSEFCKNNGKCQ